VPRGSYQLLAGDFLVRNRRLLLGDSRPKRVTGRTVRAGRSFETPPGLSANASPLPALGVFFSTPSSGTRLARTGGRPRNPSASTRRTPASLLSGPIKIDVRVDMTVRIIRAMPFGRLVKIAAEIGSCLVGRSLSLPLLKCLTP
jgi:hypothetical protein